MATIIASIGCIIIETAIGIGLSVSLNNVEVNNSNAVAAEQIRTEKILQDNYRKAFANSTQSSAAVFD
jgi:hypothetical protein